MEYKLIDDNIKNIMVDDINLNVDNNVAKISKITFEWEIDDISQVNLFRRSILSEITTYCIEYVIINTNTSSRQDEIIALRLGQLVINNEKYTQGEKYRNHFIFEGKSTSDDYKDGTYGYEYTSDDIKDVNIVIEHTTPITTLFKNQVLDFEIMIMSGKGKDHVKFRPISTMFYHKHKYENGREYFLITINSIGMLSPLSLIRDALNNMENAKNIHPQTIFSKIIS
jgi:DNA-directed RNA polymerase alpha subunit